MKARLSLLLLIALGTGPGQGRELQVAVTGHDSGNGSAEHPYRTISAAAQVAQPGDTVTVHTGTYREWIDPANGGTSDSQRITYRAAQGEKVYIKGSEVVRGWTKTKGHVWKVEIPDAFFKGYNPYVDVLKGDWFAGEKNVHAGAVFLNDDALAEAQPAPGGPELLQQGFWSCAHREGTTTLWANFGTRNPNRSRTEITTRQSCFYPRKAGRNYLTIHGFTFCQAATPWSPPTTEQIGIIGTHWSKGWIIEDNTIRDCRCAGITLGKDSDSNFQGKSESAEGFTGVVRNAMKLGWSRDTIGSHLVRNNVIYNCGQAGICGSLGAVFSRIVHNHIYNIHRHSDFDGAEIAAIKLHAAIDVLIQGNCIHDSTNGIWLDWMAQGARISGNLFYDNALDLFCEVDHGPILVDNNLFMSESFQPEKADNLAKENKLTGGHKGPHFVFNVFSRGSSIGGCSENETFAHNLILNTVHLWRDDRKTPYFAPHATSPIMMADDLGKFDDHFLNNIIWTANLRAIYDGVFAPGFTAAGNVYGKTARSCDTESHPEILPASFPKPELVNENGSIFLEMTYDHSLLDRPTNLVTTDSLGRATLPPGARTENPDGSPLQIDTDYSGKSRPSENPTPGPFQTPGQGRLKIKVWTPIAKASRPRT